MFEKIKTVCAWNRIHAILKIKSSHDSATEQIANYHARDPWCDSRSGNTRVIPGSFQLNIPIKPQTNHNQQTSRHYISLIYIQLTVYHNAHITITQPTGNSTEELIHPYIIKVALLSVSIKIVTHPPSTVSENACTLESMVSYHYPRQDEDKIIANSRLAALLWRLINHN